jgi:hypothetical protein
VSGAVSTWLEQQQLLCSLSTGRPEGSIGVIFNAHVLMLLACTMSCVDWGSEGAGGAGDDSGSAILPRSALRRLGWLISLHFVFRGKDRPSVPHGTVSTKHWNQADTLLACYVAVTVEQVHSHERSAHGMPCCQHMLSTPSEQTTDCVTAGLRPAERKTFLASIYYDQKQVPQLRLTAATVPSLSVATVLSPVPACGASCLVIPS